MTSSTFTSKPWLAICGLVLLTACSGESPTVTGVEPQFAKGGGGPAVESAQPNEAPPDITLDVRVIGSGYDQGSAVAFLVTGQSTSKILTNSSTFVDRNTLIANITIPFDADLAFYDIEVTTSRGKKGKGSELFSVKDPSQIDPSYSISFFVNPDAQISDVSDNDVVVGSENGRAALFDLQGNATPLPEPGGQSSWARNISRLGSFATGGYFDGVWSEHGLIWDLRGGVAVVTTPGILPGFPTTDYEYELYGVSEAGVAVGQILARDAGDEPKKVPTAWEFDGISTWVPRALPLVSGLTNGWALDVNDAGDIVGRNRAADFSSMHAVFWSRDTDGSYDVLDLTPLEDGTGDNMARAVTERAPDGTVRLGGHTTEADLTRATVWTVRADDHTILAELRASETGSGMDISPDGDLLINPDQVWNPNSGDIFALTSSGANCAVRGRAFDSLGRVFGSSEVSTKNGPNCSSSGRWVEERAAFWTKVGG